MTESEQTRHFSHPILILLVDDEQSILKAIVRTLRGEGYTIHTADGFESALKLIESNDFAVVISDYNMPVASGADLLGFIQTRNPNCVRIMLSGAAEADSVPEEIAEGILHCHRFLSKPWNDDQLRQIIKQSISEYDAACRAAHGLSAT